jgi:predicted dinucleotide-utilizing enzyme
MMNSRVGLIGLGYLGRFVFDQITSRPELGLEVAFVHDTAPGRLEGVPAGLILDDIRGFGSRSADLVVEMAHPVVSRDFGPMFLEQTDYMPLSMTAFADEAFQQRMYETARASGTTLFVPHGALVGLESLFEGREMWEEVTILMRKNPRNLDFSDAPHLRPPPGARATVLYEGPTRGICPLFPRNVNSHATAALVGIGFDRTHSVLISEPALEVSVIELTARGQGVSMRLERSNPLQGVSGAFTLNSTLSAITRARGAGSFLELC